MAATPASKSGSADRYFLLDGMRGVAAIAVMLFHVGWQLGLHSIVFPHGYLAVDFFFMLSGFVIADAYSNRLSKGAMSFGTFLTARIIRLYPMIFLGTCIGALVELFLALQGHSDYAVAGVAKPFLAGLVLEPFLDNPKTGLINFRFPLNEPMWSLFWEFIANIVYATFSRRVSWRVWLGVVVIFGLLIIQFGLTHNGLGRGHREWYGGFTRVGFSFFLGVALWHIRKRFTLVKIPASGLVAILVVAMAIPLLPHVNMLYDLFVAMIVFPLLVLCASKAIIGPKSVPAAEWLAAISYPLYALHYPFMSLIALAHDQLEWNRLTSVIVLIGAGIALIVLSYIALTQIDDPVRRRLRRITAVRALARAQTAP